MSIISIIVVVLIVLYSIKVLYKSYRDKRLPVALMKFENGEYHFTIPRKGYYGVSILGAAHIYEKEDVSVRLVVKQYVHKLKVQIPSVGFMLDGKKGVEYWGFYAAQDGPCEISFSNLEVIEAKKSALPVSGKFGQPIDHSDLRILIHPSDRSIVKILAVVVTVVGSLFVLLELSATVQIFK